MPELHGFHGGARSSSGAAPEEHPSIRNNAQMQRCCFSRPRQKLRSLQIPLSAAVRRVLRWQTRPGHAPSGTIDKVQHLHEPKKEETTLLSKLTFSAYHLTQPHTIQLQPSADLRVRSNLRSSSAERNQRSNFGVSALGCINETIFGEQNVSFTTRRDQSVLEFQVLYFVHCS